MLRKPQKQRQKPGNAKRKPASPVPAKPPESAIGSTAAGQRELSKTFVQEPAITKGAEQRYEVEITSKLHELISCMCVVDSREGDRRGMIERVESVILRKDFAESFRESRFKVHLTSGEVIIVPGSNISEIESAAAGIASSRRRKRRPAEPKAIFKTKLVKKISAGETTNKPANTRRQIGKKTSKPRQTQKRET